MPGSPLSSTTWPAPLRPAPIVHATVLRLRGHGADEARASARSSAPASKRLLRYTLAKNAVHLSATESRYLSPTPGNQGPDTRIAPLYQTRGRSADHHRVRLGQPLQPGGNVRRLSHRVRFPVFAAAYLRLSLPTRYGCRHGPVRPPASPLTGRVEVLRLEWTSRRDPYPGRPCARRIVLMGRRIAKVD